MRRAEVTSSIDAGPMERPRLAAQQPKARLRLVLSSTLAYAILARLTNLSVPEASGIAELWLPAGLSMALAVRIGFWAIPVPGLGLLLSQLDSSELLRSAVIWSAIGQSCSTALMVVLSRRWMRGVDLFASISNLASFLVALVLSATLNTLISAIGVPLLRNWSPEGDALGWWGGEMAGAIVLAPVLLSWMGRSVAPRLRELRRPEYLLLVLGCGLAALVANLGGIKVLSLTPQSLLLPLMIWSGLRFSPPAATLANTLLALALVAIPNQVQTVQILGRTLEAQELEALEVSTSLVVGLVVLVVSNSSSRMRRQLWQLSGSLERTVAERTDALAQANAQLRHLSETDGLTSLTNRRQFDRVLQERWRQAAQAGTSLAVAMVDIDHFKAYNDHYGHQAGDRCLQRVAQTLAGHIRNSSDCVARYGGEEFVLLWSGVNSEQAATLAERLRQEIAALNLPHAASPMAAKVSLSIGVASQAPERQTETGPADEIQQHVEALLQQADERLYAAKAAGRNRVVAC